MDLLIILAALFFLMWIAYRGHSVILFAPVAALGAVLATDPSLVALDPRSRVIASWVDGEQVFGPDGPSRLDAGAIVADADEARRRIM